MKKRLIFCIVFLFLVQTAFAVVQPPLRINSAGQAYTDTSGNLWLADKAYSSGSWGYVGGSAVNRWDTDPSLNIAGTNDDALYVTERYGSFAYQIDVPNGDYNVILHFAETWDGTTGPGQRDIDVLIEGLVVLDNLDPYAEGGFARAIVKTARVNVIDGQLNLAFSSTIPSAMINAIEILEARGLIGDTNGDGKVTLADFFIFIANFGKTSGFEITSDVNADGNVNLFDIVLVAKNIGDEAPTGPICGENGCESGETCSNCPEDCDPCPVEPWCGDTFCNGDETCNTCPKDCDACPPPTTSNLRELGYLDVTTHGADPTGVRDSTVAIQQAMDEAWSNSLVTYFPNQPNGQRGVYLVSNTLYASYKRNVRYDCVGLENWRANILMGSTVGGVRPLIKLKAGVARFSDPNNPLPLIWMWAIPHKDQSIKDPLLEDTDINFNSIFRGIDIDLGANPGAIGIKNRGAQGASIEDTKITATGAFAGVRGLGVLGWQISNIEVVGGRYGIYANHDNSANPWTVGTGHGPIIGSVFRDQTHAVFKFVSSPGPVLCVGCHIINAKSPILDSAGLTYRNGFNIVDSVIEMQSGTVMPASKNIFLRDVYVKGANSVVPSWTIGNPSGWTWVKEYHSLASGAPKQNLVNGNVNTNEYKSKIENQAVTQSQLVNSLIEKHRWHNRPSFTDVGVVNVKDVGAKGDATTDDTQAIQYAIDNYQKVFLPHGTYLISDTINLRSNTQIFGSSRAFSHILPHSNWNPVGENALVRTVNDKNAVTSMSDIVVSRSYFLESLGENGFQLIHWRAGRNSVTWDVTANGCGAWQADMHNLVNNYPTYKFTDSGGGRHFGILGRTLAYNTRGTYMRAILIDGTSEPLDFYGFNHAREPLELVVEVKDSQNVRFHHPTHEGGKRTYKFTNSNNVVLIGGVKGGYTSSGDSTFEIINSDNIIIEDYAMYRILQTTGEHALSETYGGTTKRITNDNHIGLFKRGEPDFTVIS